MCMLYHDILFVHIPKNAGSSIRKIFLDLGGLYINQQGFGPHVRAEQLRRMFGVEYYQKLFSFAIVRNPWDWYVSLYIYIKEHENAKHHPHRQIIQEMSFKEYVKYHIDNQCMTQLQYASDINGNVIVSQLFQFEDINNIYKNTLRSRILGVQCDNLLHLNKTPHKHYSTWYTNDLINVINIHEHKLITLMKYTFT